MGIFSFGSKRAGSSAGRAEGSARSRAAGGRSRRLEPGLDVGGADNERVASRSRRARGVGQEAMLDPTLPEKQRARRRLVGAIALVLAAVIILPMVLDATPKPATGDIAIDIPDQGQSTAPAQRANAALDNGADAVHQDVAAGAAADSSGKSGASTTGAGKTAGTTTTGAISTSKPSNGATGGAPSSQRFAEVFDSASSAPGSADNGATRSSTRPGSAAHAAANAATAADSDLAARVATLPATPATPGARYVVQLGSFESTASAQEWVRKLKRIGVPAFVNTDKGSDGITRAQLRAGPFADRTIAQAAVQKVRMAGLTQTADAGNGR